MATVAGGGGMVRATSPATSKFPAPELGPNILLAAPAEMRTDASPVAAALAERAAPQFSSNVSMYRVPTNAPQVSTDPLSGVAAKYIPNLRQNMDIGETPFTALSGAAPMMTAPNIMANADAALALMDYEGQQRIAAGREQEIARGMARSGVALALEDRIAKENELYKAAEYSDYANRQAELDQTAALANQSTELAWRGMVDASNQFKAAEAQERQLANQAAKIEMAGLQTQWASTLAQIATERASLNATMRQTQQQMLRSASEFDKSQELSTWVAQQQAAYQTGTLNETRRNNDMNFSLGQQRLDQIAAGGGTNWADMLNDALVYQSDYAGALDPLADTRSYLDAYSNGEWTQNPGLVSMFNTGVAASPEQKNRDAYRRAAGLGG